MATKKTNSGDMLSDTARVIGTALGTMSAQAEALTAQAKKIHMPSKQEARTFVEQMLSGKEKAAAKVAVKVAVKKKAAPKKSVAKKSARKK
jgi:hypothetical protein